MSLFAKLKKIVSNDTKQSIFLNAMPKSASSFIPEIIQKHLQLQSLELSNQGAINDHNLIAPKLIEFCKGGYIARQTIPASNLNLLLLNYYKIKKMILHVRDPRQAMVSWMFYLQERGKRFENNIHPDQELTLMYYRYPKDLLDLPLSDQINWHIKNYYVENIKWVQKWIDFKKNSLLDLDGQKINFELDIFYSSYEGFISNKEKFIREILEFYNLTDQKVDKNEIFRENSKIPNFRKGSTNEWEEIMSAEQKKLVNSYITTDMTNNFGWEI